jgi:hypothetical protein
VKAAGAILLGFMVVASTSRTALHFHHSSDHEHSEHHHGLAAHEHSTPAQAPARHGTDPSDDETRSHLKSCDPGDHVVSVVMRCPPPGPLHVLAAASAGADVLAPPVTVHRVYDLTDLRSHGPPRSEASPRGPPSRPHLIS